MLEDSPLAMVVATVVGIPVGSTSPLPGHLKPSGHSALIALPGTVGLEPEVAVSAAVTGQIVVYKGIVSVVTEPLPGQLGTLSGHFVIV